MSIAKVSLGFATLPDPDLDAFTENLLTCLTGNANYTTPDPPLADIQTLLDAFTAALAAAASAGKAATAVKNAAREALLDGLRTLAAYVQSKCQGDLAILLSSGFDAISTNHAQSELATPAILSITNGASTTLTLKVKSVPNARAYEVRYSSTPNTWQSAGTFTQARRIVIWGLTPGTTYTFQVRAIGGLTGYSDWCDPSSHMAT